MDLYATLAKQKEAGAIGSDQVGHCLGIAAHLGPSVNRLITEKQRAP
jgi:hypothetical protein